MASERNAPLLVGTARRSWNPAAASSDRYWPRAFLTARGAFASVSRTAGWSSGSRRSSVPAGSSGATTVSQRAAPSGMSVFFAKPSMPV
jgi:hypothetical protein